MKFSKSNLYKRLFITYTIVILSVVSILCIYFLSKTSEEIKRNNLYLNDKILQDVNETLEYNSSTSRRIMNMLYEDDFRLNDVIKYLNSDLVDYIKGKLDYYSASDKLYYNGIESFVKSSFQLNNFLKSISFISYSRNEISVFNRKGEIKTYPFNSNELLDKKDIEYAIYNKNEISIINEIRDAASLKPEGMLMTTYDVGVISDVIKKYKDTNSEVLILNKEGMVLYDSENKYDYEYYPYFDKLKVGRHEILLEDNYYVDILPDNNGLMSLVRIKVSNATKVPILFKVSALLVSLLLFIIAECVLYIKFKNLSSRMDSLVLAMEKVEKGDIDVHIPLSKDRDEITFIADNFNKMCEKLNDHIRKSYLAELRQREAEIVALQNQINPHFLYNTLESIRMKAICNGDKEVGKMLYSLAFLFRSQVKGNLIVSIDQEIKYCNKYLELFKFRYYEKFKFKIECEEDLYDKGIVKFTLQPLIENYFVHGIRLERDDNELKIYIYKHLEDIVVEVIDNGRGIPKEKLDDINRRIRECDHSGKSIGMLNVHERIKIKYGEPYGLTVTSEENKGTNMILKFPLREVE
ncbi:sensor histidine kinase [Clostridium perfringens]|nr:sensor histidine kinase [Clostridium perfringens]ELP5181788.1 sensor histidine kinase [Clostridium perfringens]ELP5183535.1 sensor histidine kinase [Clostridium perfringens]ELP5187447.1 sensor histidine kinase [Clostridium perfringens]